MESRQAPLHICFLCRVAGTHNHRFAVAGDIKGRALSSRASLPAFSRTGFARSRFLLPRLSIVAGPVLTVGSFGLVAWAVLTMWGAGCAKRLQNSFQRLLSAAPETGSTPFRRAMFVQCGIARFTFPKRPRQESNLRPTA